MRTTKYSTASILVFAVLLFIASSCKKNWLEQKSSSELLVPTSLPDMRQLLNNREFVQLKPMLTIEASADDFFYTPTVFANLSIVNLNRKAYIWELDGNYGTAVVSGEWNNSYKKVFLSNLVLEGLNKIDSNINIDEWRSVRGMALFYRGEAFHDLAQLFSETYQDATADDRMGIPIQLSTELNNPLNRSSVRQTYGQIIADLKGSAALLSEASSNKYDPSRYAAYSLLARIYLSTGNFEEAFFYSDMCIKSNSTILNYLDINVASSVPFNVNNPELLYISNIQPLGIYSTGSIDTSLLASYSSNDRRIQLFFSKRANGTYTRKGSYTGSLFVFGGSSVNEMLLTRAECYARQGNSELALNDLNYLLTNRIENFEPYSLDNENEVLRLILEERRKELVGRAIRWMDLKRLNKEPAFAKTLERNLPDGLKSLPPNDNRYVFPIPNYIVQSSKIQQSPR